ncbi:hypothetical protein V1478_008970 [Vespula squamosa]|uniref:Uncharacterized protein n=1 Tax=Vespula squamosa TaxID=30214 RepID=A0ABD2AUZ8_VESSQ
MNVKWARNLPGTQWYRVTAVEENKSSFSHAEGDVTSHFVCYAAPTITIIVKVYALLPGVGFEWEPWIRISTNLSLGKIRSDISMSDNIHVILLKLPQRICQGDVIKPMIHCEHQGRRNIICLRRKKQQQQKKKEKQKEREEKEPQEEEEEEEEDARNNSECERNLFDTYDKIPPKYFRPVPSIGITF